MGAAWLFRTMLKSRCRARKDATFAVSEWLVECCGSHVLMGVEHGFL